MKLLKTFIIFAASTLAQPVGQDQNTETSVDQPASQMQHDAVDPPVYEDEPEEVAEEEQDNAAAADEATETTNQDDTDAPADDSPAATEDGKTSVEANAGESDDAADEQEPDDTSTSNADEDTASDDTTPDENTSEDTSEDTTSDEDNSEDNKSGEFDTQTVKTTLTVGEKAHNMCNLADVDQNTYRCDETEDEFLRCTASCPSGAGIIKQNCECYKYFGPLVLYDPDNCIWNNFDDQCFDEDPIPVGGYPDSSEDSDKDCDDCGLAAEKIGDAPETDTTESTDNPKFMRPVKVVSNDETDGDSWFAAEDLDDQAHFSGFLRHLDRWAKLTLVAVEQGEMQPVMYQQL